MFDNTRDVERMARISRGDVRAFEDLFHSYQKHIAAFFYHLCWDHQKSQDLLQEVFLRVWKSAGDYRGTGRFSTYLYQIAKNLWINEKAKENRRIRPLSLGDPERGSDADEIEDGDRSPEDRILNRELSEEIRRAVSELDEKKRMVFVLSEYQDLKYADIAEILGIPEGTVKSRMAAAERLLRAKLKRYLSDRDGRL